MDIRISFLVIFTQLLISFGISSFLQSINLYFPFCTNRSNPSFHIKLFKIFYPALLQITAKNPPGVYLLVRKTILLFNLSKNFITISPLVKWN